MRQVDCASNVGQIRLQITGGNGSIFGANQHARILLRSAFETVATLIYLNQITRNVLAGKLDFHDFSEKTTTLLLGSRDNSTSHKSLNIVTILNKCDGRYPGIEKLYAILSESSHPNYEGTCIGYSNLDRTNDTTIFLNKWNSMYANGHVDSIELCTATFYNEYNEEWQDAFEQLEAWVVANDDHLEKTKRGN
jgi:hypothetical protein